MEHNTIFNSDLYFSTYFEFTVLNITLIDNLYYPEWLEGTWDVTQTLVKVSTPLGTKFVGGPAGSEAIAAESLKVN